MPPSARSRMPPTSRSSPRSGRAPACWRTSRRRSRSGVPPRRAPRRRRGARSRSRRGPWPRSARASGCWTRSPVAPGRGRVAARPARRRPSAPWPPSIARVAGGRRARPGRAVVAITSARSSVPRAAWTRRSAPTSRRWRSPRRPAGRPCPRRASRTWAWPRWPTSGTSSTPPWSTSPRASRCAASSATPSRWPPAWPPWRGSGRPGRCAPAPWRRWTRPSGSRRARRWSTCSTRCRRSGRGCCWPRATSPRPPAGRSSAASAPDDEPSYPREPEYLVLARVLLAQDRPDQALALLDRLHAAAAAQDRTGSVIEIQALRALALAAARRRGRRGGRPGRGAHPGLPPGLRPGLRRRGRRRWRAPARPAHRGPDGRTCRGATASRSAAWPGCCGALRRPTGPARRGRPGDRRRRCRAWSSR